LLGKLDEFEFGFGGSILLANRFLLLLVAALSFTTLASADSTNVSAAFLHSRTGASGVANTRFTTNSGMATPTSMMFVANNASDSTHIPSVGRLHTNFRLQTPKWNIEEGGHRLSTPEPASLMLLSTGLIGIAGMLRRKLPRG
jgi:hypothetical protein